MLKRNNKESEVKHKSLHMKEDIFKTEANHHHHNTHSSELLSDIIKKIKSEKESLENQFHKPRSKYHR